MPNPGDRTQYSFTFTNADPDESVTFTAPVYGAATGREIGPRLELDADSSVTVWSDAAVLTAVTVDGQGLELRATATRDNPSITNADGTAPVNSPHAGGTSVPAEVVKVSVNSGAGGTFDFYVPPTFNGYYPTFLAAIGQNGYFGITWRGAATDINFVQTKVVKASDGTLVGMMQYDGLQSLVNGGPIALGAAAGDWTAADDLAFDPVGFAPNYLSLPAASPFAQYLVAMQIVLA